VILRAMDFLVELFRNLLTHPDWTMSQACTDSYGKTLKKFHGWLASSSFTVCLFVSDLFSSILIFSLYEWKVYAKYFASCWPKQDDGIPELIWLFLELHIWKLSWTIANRSKPWIMREHFVCLSFMRKWKPLLQLCKIFWVHSAEA